MSANKTTEESQKWVYVCMSVCESVSVCVSVCVSVFFLKCTKTTLVYLKVLRVKGDVMGAICFFFGGQKPFCSRCFNNNNNHWIGGGGGGGEKKLCFFFLNLYPPITKALIFIVIIVIKSKETTNIYIYICIGYI